MQPLVFGVTTRGERLQWTVDGAPLRNVVPGLKQADTFGDPNYSPQHQMLLALLGEESPERRFEVRMATGEVMVASDCSPACCPAVTARVELTETEAIWHDIAWRDWWDGSFAYGSSPETLRFGRASYEATIRELLAAIPDKEL
ncbi:hypothetical protein [Nocardioides yefusunii]|uniref:Uncharacterized protein n=1 Tax=Nocardioides yefusunii TaxID=2500546 RepID=A0ABW1R1B3_9ACTN|nr:hypothetical protein [Nocardioides yefusunii]